MSFHEGVYGREMGATADKGRSDPGGEEGKASDHYLEPTMNNNREGSRCGSHWMPRSAQNDINGLF
jgi:hypothetical protein